MKRLFNAMYLHLLFYYTSVEAHSQITSLHDGWMLRWLDITFQLNCVHSAKSSTCYTSYSSIDKVNSNRLCLAVPKGASCAHTIIASTTSTTSNINSHSSFLNTRQAFVFLLANAMAVRRRLHSQRRRRRHILHHLTSQPPPPPTTTESQFLFLLHVPFLLWPRIASRSFCWMAFGDINSDSRAPFAKICVYHYVCTYI